MTDDEAEGLHVVACDVLLLFASFGGLVDVAQLVDTDVHEHEEEDGGEGEGDAEGVLRRGFAVRRVAPRVEDEEEDDEDGLVGDLTPALH